VKYLLKAAAVKASHLKRIDVICLDSGGRVKQRYDELITFVRYRFVNARVEDYLDFHSERLLGPEGPTLRPDPLICDKLEVAHEAFFEKAAK
jgi:hypothetical protein